MKLKLLKYRNISNIKTLPKKRKNLKYMSKECLIKKSLNKDNQPFFRHFFKKKKTKFKRRSRTTGGFSRNRT